MEQAEVNQPIQKSGSNKTIFIVLAIAIFLFLCFCCGTILALAFFVTPTTTTNVINDDVIEIMETATPQRDEVEVYGRGEVADMNGIVIYIKDFDSDYYSQDLLYTPKGGLKLVSVQVHMLNDSSSNTDYSYADFALKDDNNYKYSYLLTSYGAKLPSLGSGILNPSDEAEGWITFEVPSDSSGYNLVYTNPSTRDMATIEI